MPLSITMSFRTVGKYRLDTSIPRAISYVATRAWLEPVYTAQGVHEHGHRSVYERNLA